jgi:hypothetical protein
MPEQDDAFQSPVSDTVTETTHRSWGQKLADSIKGVAIGGVMVVASVVGLFWNEGRSVQTIKSLAEGRGAVVSVEPGKIDAQNESKLIHVSGDLKTGAPLTDPEFGVTATAVQLVRKVEMYQWEEEKREETKKELGGGETKVTTYRYAQKWVDHAVNSSRFKTPAGHQNPTFLYGRKSVVAQDATLGAFKPTEAALRHLSASTPMPIDAALTQQIAAKLGKPVQVVDGVVYLAENPKSPRIGDIRVSYSIAKAGTSTFLGRQSGTDIQGYKTKAGDELLFARTGAVSADDIFKQEASANRLLTWVLRGVLALVMFIGFAAIFSPLVAVADVVPFIGNILGAGTGFIAFVLTAIIAPLVIAIAWFYYRPLVSLAVLAGGAIVAFLVSMMAKSRAAAKRQAAAPQPAH